MFFGPTMLRTRIEGGADDVAAPALRYGATALTVAVLLLLLLGTGVGGADLASAGALLAAAGWLLVIVTLATQVAIALWPLEGRGREPA